MNTFLTYGMIVDSSRDRWALTFIAAANDWSSTPAFSSKILFETEIGMGDHQRLGWGWVGDTLSISLTYWWLLTKPRVLKMTLSELAELTIRMSLASLLFLLAFLTIFHFGSRMDHQHVLTISENRSHLLQHLSSNCLEDSIKYDEGLAHIIKPHRLAWQNYGLT